VIINLFFVVTHSRFTEDVRHLARSRLEYHRSRLQRGDDEYRQKLRERIRSEYALGTEEGGGGGKWSDVGAYGEGLMKEEYKAREKRYDEDMEAESYERLERTDRNIVGERGERAERTERSERGMRGERGDRGDRAERAERGERIDMWEAGERGMRGEIAERTERLASVNRVSDGNPASLLESAVEEPDPYVESAAAEEELRQALLAETPDEDTGFENKNDMPEIYYKNKHQENDEEVAVGSSNEYFNEETLMELYQDLELYDSPE